MDRRDFLKKIGLGAAALTIPKLTYGMAGPPKKPNLLFVFPDQMRKHALGFINEDPAITPNLDKSARESMVFTNAISSNPICTPFRAMLMTGRHSISIGMVSNCQPGLNQELSEKEICISDILKTNGYQAGYIGKWHLEMPSRNKYENPPDDPDDAWDGWTTPGPRRHGFDFWYAYNTDHEHFTPNYWKDKPQKIQVAQWSVEHETDVAIDFIKNRKKDKPFALFISHNPPHGPYIAPEKYKAMYLNRHLPPRPNVKLPNEKYLTSIMPYLAAVSSCDDNFARLLKTLEDEKITEDTIVVFTSDHGDMMGSHERFGKSTWHEESIGIPFIIRWPGRIKPATEDMPFACYDFMPTLLGLMGLSIPKAVEGTNYSKLMLGKKMNKPSAAFIAYYQYPDKVMAVGQPASIWVQQGVDLRKKGIDWRTIGFRGLVTKRYTYVVDRYSDGPDGPYSTDVIAEAIADGTITKRLLYDNEKDPYQLNPIVAIRADENIIMAKLDNELQQWLDKMNDPFPLK
ncbi:MAG: sulfatase family protein [Planctomycetota bacterium]|jgi:arylsulfatase A-like enzyme